MADAMRAMLDGLMGSDRDMTEVEKEKNKRTFDSPEVHIPRNRATSHSLHSSLLE